MTPVTSLRAFKATKTLAQTQGLPAARRVVQQLEVAPSNMLRFAIANARTAPGDPRAALTFLREHRYIERDRCEACGKPTERYKRVWWKNKENRRRYACNKKCARAALRKRA